MMEHDELTRFFYHLLCWERGILPLERGELERDLGPTLDSFEPDEARVMKRKFRKLWRKIYDRPMNWSSYWSKREPWRRKRCVYVMMRRLAEKKAQEMIEKSVKGDGDGIK